MFINLYMLFSLFHNKLSRAQCSFVCKKGEGLTNRFAHFCNFNIKSVILVLESHARLPAKEVLFHLENKGLHLPTSHPQIKLQKE